MRSRYVGIGTVLRGWASEERYLVSGWAFTSNVLVERAERLYSTDDKIVIIKIYTWQVFDNWYNIEIDINVFAVIASRLHYTYLYLNILYEYHVRNVQCYYYRQSSDVLQIIIILLLLKHR